jgi:hypothetical protein
MKTINTTLKINEHELTNFESWLREQLEVISFKVIADTNELYESDTTFKKLVKACKDANDAKADYINKFNK